MKVLSKINLKLNWKKSKILYSFSAGQDYDVPQDVAEYLVKVYKDKFETLQILLSQSPIIATIPNATIPIENGLNELINEELTIRKLIEKSLEKNIIEKNGTSYYFDNKFIAKGIKNLENILSNNQELFSEIKSKL